jgi:hypothetical protein
MTTKPSDMKPSERIDKLWGAMNRGVSRIEAIIAYLDERHAAGQGPAIGILPAEYWNIYYVSDGYHGWQLYSGPFLSEPEARAKVKELNARENGNTYKAVHFNAPVAAPPAQPMPHDWDEFGTCLCCGVHNVLTNGACPGAPPAQPVPLPVFQRTAEQLVAKYPGEPVVALCNCGYAAPGSRMLAHGPGCALVAAARASAQPVAAEPDTRSPFQVRNGLNSDGTVRVSPPAVPVAPSYPFGGLCTCQHASDHSLAHERGCVGYRETAANNPISLGNVWVGETKPAVPVAGEPDTWELAWGREFPTLVEKYKRDQLSNEREFERAGFKYGFLAAAKQRDASNALLEQERAHSSALRAKLAELLTRELEQVRPPPPFAANSATPRTDCPTPGCWFHGGHTGRHSTDESEPPVQPSELDVARAEVKDLECKLNSKQIHNAQLLMQVKRLEDSSAQLHRENDAALARVAELEAEKYAKPR